jgi:hypothetical protein
VVVVSSDPPPERIPPAFVVYQQIAQVSAQGQMLGASGPIHVVINPVGAAALLRLVGPEKYCLLQAIAWSAHLDDKGQLCAQLSNEELAAETGMTLARVKDHMALRKSRRQLLAERGLEADGLVDRGLVSRVQERGPRNRVRPTRLFLHGSLYAKTELDPVREQNAPPVVSTSGGTHAPSASSRQAPAPSATRSPGEHSPLVHDAPPDPSAGDNSPTKGASSAGASSAGARCSTGSELLERSEGAICASGERAPLFVAGDELQHQRADRDTTPVESAEPAPGQTSGASSGGAEGTEPDTSSASFERELASNAAVEQLRSRLKRLRFYSPARWLASLSAEQVELAAAWCEHFERLPEREAAKLTNPAGLLRSCVEGGEPPPTTGHEGEPEPEPGAPMQLVLLDDGSVARIPLGETPPGAELVRYV